MANAKSKSSLKRAASRVAKSSAQQHVARRPPQSGTATQPSINVPPPITKNAKILSMLRSPTGVTIAVIMNETGWQQHSVRGFLAGVVRKRLKLNLVSKMAEVGRIYRINDKRSTATKGASAKRT